MTAARSRGQRGQPLDRIRAAFEAVDRREFLPDQVRRYASENRPLSIGFNQTNSQPRTVADMLTLLDVPRGARVLDVGAGSGWTTALLAELAGPDGQVVGTEIVSALATFGSANLAAAQRPWARIEQADPARLGWPDDAPYDRILVSAGATRVPDQLVSQLVNGGVMVIPVAGRMGRVTRRGPGHDVDWHGAYRFVPLREPRATAQPAPADPATGETWRPSNTFGP